MRWREFKQLLDHEAWLTCAIVGLILIPGLVALVCAVVAVMKWLLA